MPQTETTHEGVLEKGIQAGMEVANIAMTVMGGGEANADPQPGGPLP